MNLLSPGDIVTRDGTDRFVVEYITDDELSGAFRCIQKSTVLDWIEIDEVDYAAVNRYTQP